jgi:hypothetical protein
MNTLKTADELDKLWGRLYDPFPMAFRYRLEAVLENPLFDSVHAEVLRGITFEVWPQ